MNQIETTYANFIESVCRQYNIPDAVAPLVEGFDAYCAISNQALMEGAVFDKIKSAAKNVILPIIAAVLMNTGTATAGNNLNQCETVNDCVETIQAIKNGSKPITKSQINKIKELAENEDDIDYCKIMPRGILCKKTPSATQLEIGEKLGVTSTGMAEFTPMKPISEVPNDVYSINFSNSIRGDSFTKTMVFSYDDGSMVIYNATSNQSVAEVTRFDEFAGISKEQYDYQSVVNYINTVFNACKH